jgi:hypothetical protein
MHDLHSSIIAIAIVIIIVHATRTLKQGLFILLFTAPVNSRLQQELADAN